MEAVKVALLCVAGAMLCSVRRPLRPEMALVTALAAGVFALMFCLTPLRETVEALQDLSGQAGLSSASSQLLFRALGISLLCDFGAQLCRDAGESALSGRVELAGRVTLLSMAAPMLLNITRQLAALLP